MPYSIPWHVAFVIKGSDVPFCAGTLISDRHVLTAAHCTRFLVERGYEGEIIVGEHDIASSEDGTRHTYSHYTDHPSYNKNDFSYDFSILHLRTPVQIGSRANVACMPPAKFAGNYLAGKSLTVSGWGARSEGGRPPTTLHAVRVPGISNYQCRRSYRSITDAMICAGQTRGGVDSCQGDSGGK